MRVARFPKHLRNKYFLLKDKLHTVEVVYARDMVGINVRVERCGACNVSLHFTADEAARIAKCMAKFVPDARAIDKSCRKEEARERRRKRRGT